MDLGLPDIDGNEITKYIRQMEKDTPHRAYVIGLSAHVGPSTKYICFDAGMDDVFSKPLLQLNAKKTIEQLMEYQELRSNVEKEFQQNKTEQQPPITHLKIINLVLGATLINSDVEAAKKMLGLLVETLPETKHNLEKAYQDKNIEDLMKITHKFYGGLCYCGTPRLRHAVKILNAALKFSDINSISSIYANVCDEISIFIEAYKNLSLLDS